MSALPDSSSGAELAVGLGLTPGKLMPSAVKVRIAGVRADFSADDAKRAEAERRLKRLQRKHRNRARYVRRMIRGNPKAFSAAYRHAKPYVPRWRTGVQP